MSFLARKILFLSAKQKVRNSNLGASLGLPIIRDKLFFFGSFEKQEFKLGVAGNGLMPSQAYQQEAIQLMSTYHIGVNPVSQAMLNTFWPASALTGPATPSGNYVSPDATTGHTDNGSIKFDYNINSKNSVSFHWFSGEGSQIAPAASHLLWYYSRVPTRVQNYAIVWNNQITSRASAIRSCLVATTFLSPIAIASTISILLRWVSILVPTLPVRPISS